MNQIEVELQEFMGSDRSIAEAAWTSSTSFQAKNKKTEEDVIRVVNMLADSGHSTPFESVVLRFWIKMPIQTDRQHVTHRIATHNGASGRYRTMPDEVYELPQDCIDILNKGTVGAKGMFYEHEYKVLCNKTNALYREVLNNLKQSEKTGLITNDEYKRVREVYRGILPQNNMTERVTVMNLRSFSNYQKLRNSSYAQPEIKRVAELMLESVIKANIAPVAIEALKRNKWTI